MRLDGKVAVITGAGGGIGAATARRFAKEGATVVCVDVAAQAGQQVADEIGGEYVQVDVTDEGQVRELFQGVVDRHGGLHIAFNNAGISPPEDDSILTTGMEAWDRVQALFQTVGEDELVDPQVTPATLLYRLFHEDGVRLFTAKPLKAFCRCSETRVIDMLRAFPPEDRADMVEPDGAIRVTCEYCSKSYVVQPDAVEPGG